jgi:hypothetical protein
MSATVRALSQRLAVVSWCSSRSPLRGVAAGRSPTVEVVEAAVGDAPGRASLSISERTPTVTTLAAAWREARAREPEFARVRWNRRIEVDTTTLDRLIARFGVPAFIKIDVEGSESTVRRAPLAVPALHLNTLGGSIRWAHLARLNALKSSSTVARRVVIAGAGLMADERELLAKISAPEVQRRAGMSMPIGW